MTPWTADSISVSPRVSPNSCPLCQWCHPTLSSSVLPFSSCPQSFLASGSIPVSQLFISGGHSIGASASTSVLPMNIQGWFPLGLTGLISLQPKGLLRVFSNTTIQKHQFFSAQPSLESNSHIHTWLWVPNYGIWDNFLVISDQQNADQPTWERSLRNEKAQLTPTSQAHVQGVTATRAKVFWNISNLPFFKV